jgi:hypothetical protein
VVGVARAPLDGGRAGGVRRVPRVVGARRPCRFPRRRPRPDRTFPRCGPGRRHGVAHAPRRVDRDRRGPARVHGGRGAAGGGAVLAQARSEPRGPGGGEPRAWGPPGRTPGRGPDLPPAGDRRAGSAPGPAALSGVARRRGRERRAVDPGAGGRPPHGRRGHARRAEPRRRVGRGAARPERALAGPAGALRRRHPAVRGRCGTAGRGADRGSGGTGGRAQGRPPRLPHRDVGGMAGGARPGDRRDQRGARQPVRPPRARGARPPGAGGRHRAADRPRRHHHSHDRRYP